MDVTTEISRSFEENKQFKHALEVMQLSGTTILITGKAGTGKSTLLRHFVETSGKNCVVLAPTGIAAINAGGQTVHSFFGFPVRPMIPGDSEIKKFSKHHPKSKIIQKMEVLIIDEVSMLRADIMDAIDHSLRLNTGKNIPFGGKQLVLIGDIFQLEPVIQNNAVEQHLFTEVYRSHYFFDALVFSELYLPNLELTKVYRQKDEDFIFLLDSVRTNMVGDEDLYHLNSRFDPDFEPAPDDMHVTLCTRNYMAENINDYMLSQLEGEIYEFKGKIEGEFNERNLPTSYILELKIGAQIVFIKNSASGKYVNGTIGKVKNLDAGKINIELENGEEIEIQQEEWENKVFGFDNVNKRIKSDVIGRFFQYPIKLAWAITIHKSQGLTFDKAIVDFAGGTFAHGQLYVALSRCRTMEGLILRQTIQRQHVIVDERVVDFAMKNLLTE